MENKKEMRRIILWSTLVGVGLLLVLWGNGRTPASAGTEYQTHIPVVIALPTPSPVPPPQFVAEVELTGAECPTSIYANPFNGLVYTTNTDSRDVSVLSNNQFLHNVPTGEKPTDIASIPNSAYTYITNLTNQASANQIALFNGPNLQAMLPKHFEPHDVVVNPVNGLTYITDLDSTVTVFNFDQLVTHIRLDGAGWVRAIVADPMTGLVYAASWERGIVYVIQGTTLIHQFQVGWGILEMALDPVSGYFYVANSEPSAAYPGNISIFHRNDYTVTSYRTAVRSFDVDVESLHGYAYFANNTDNTISVVKGRTLIGTVPTGLNPTGVAANSNTGFAIITNEFSNSITIMKDGVVVGTETVGQYPYKAAVNHATNDFYILNRHRISWRDPENRERYSCNLPTVSIYH